jgi:hypothetical protein
MRYDHLDGKHAGDMRQRARYIDPALHATHNRVCSRNELVQLLIRRTGRKPVSDHECARDRVRNAFRRWIEFCANRYDILYQDWRDTMWYDYVVIIHSIVLSKHGWNVQHEHG